MRISKQRCVFRGHKTRALQCGTCKDGVAVYQCTNPAVPSPECVLAMEGGVRADAIREAQLPVCRDCDERVFDTHLRPAQLSGVPKVENKASRLWRERRERRNPSPPTKHQSVVVNVDSHGFGDVITAAWIAEGTKNHVHKLLIHATGDKANVLRMFGQPVIPHPPEQSKMGQATRMHHMLKGHPPRIYAWCAQWGIEARFARPAHNVEETELHLAARKVGSDPPYICLCPQSAHADREWPASYFLELAGRLNDYGTPLICGTPDHRFARHPGYQCGKLTWREFAAVMLQSRLVVGNDSAPVHLAGTLDVPAIAVLGPTDQGALVHLPSVRCISCPRRIVECAGCWWGWKYNAQECRYNCAALSNITPAQVTRAAQDIICNGSGEASQRNVDQGRPVHAAG